MPTRCHPSIEPTILPECDEPAASLGDDAATPSIRHVDEPFAPQPL
jgi:hypothetical protein